MNDLIERLRRPVTRINAEVALLAEAAGTAADEIEELKHDLNEYRRIVKEQTAEIERLRERVMDQEEKHADALREIDRLREWIACDIRCPCCQQIQTCSDDCTFSVDAPVEYERMEIARDFLAPVSLCECDLRTKLVGDGCEFCTPELAEELKEQK